MQQQIKEQMKTFEEAILAIDSVKEEKDPANLQAVLSKLRTLLEERVSRQVKKHEDTGGAAVKAAVIAGRGFKPYMPQPIPTT